MGDKLKQLGVRFLLLITKSFVYLGTTLRKRTPPGVVNALKIFGQRTIYVVLVAVSPFYRVYRRLRRALNQLLENPSPWLKPLSHRYALHILTIVIAGVAVYGNIVPAGAENFGEGRLVLQLLQNSSASDIPGFEATVDASQLGGTDNTPGTTADIPPQPALGYDGETAFQPYLPSTANSVAPRQKIEQYIVRDGDTPAGIAAKFQLQLATLLGANNLGTRALIHPGQTLTILPIDGLLHTVKKGDTVATIAKRYQVSPDTILSYNRLPNDRSVVQGQTLIIPGGTPPAAPPPTPAPRYPPSRNNGNIAQVPSIPQTPAVDQGLKLLWPTVSHHINQYFSWTHHALDIHGVIGAPIYAAESGVVLESRWDGPYGNMTLIKHDDGLITRYGHAIKNLTAAGQRVERGQIIALLGSTGNSTGPHVHFEVIVGKTLVNPLAYTH